MLTSFKKVLLAACAAAGGLALASAAPAATPYEAFDVHAAKSWAERLVLCDYTAFLSGRPDLYANQIWVKRDDGHSDLLLPPDYVGGGSWYKEAYERLFRRLGRKGEVDADQVRQVQATVGHDLLEIYRRGRPWSAGDMSFLRKQDAYCRSLARQEGEFVS